MQVIPTEINDLYIIEPCVFEDNRGCFYEAYNKTRFKEDFLDCHFVQDNVSFSRFGTVRGLHFQKGNFAQTKLVYVLYGKVLDVVVDLRRESQTFGKSFSIELSSENKKQLLIPKGFAHGFSALSETAVFYYKCDNIWHRESESGIRYNDKTLNINWQINHDQIIISERDKLLPTMEEFFGI
jgi:dTDP-4-dehydrorhamnose 3,5-epimerase